MAGLVERDELTARKALHSVLLLEADHLAVDCGIDLVVADLVAALAGGVDGGLVEEVLERRAREARGAARDALQVDTARERLAAGVDLQDGRAAVEVGQVDGDAAVETARAGERVVEDVGTVGGGDGDDARVALEPVHLGENLEGRGGWGGWGGENGLGLARGR